MSAETQKEPFVNKIKFAMIFIATLFIIIGVFINSEYKEYALTISFIALCIWLFTNCSFLVKGDKK